MSDNGPGAREVAYRPFAAEFDDATLSYSESDEERAPNYVVTPTGARVNRLFAVGVLTEVERINEDTRRGRIVDPSGAFVTYAGQYQPDAQTFLERADPPAFVALTGKARTFQPEDSDRVFTSVRPESINEVDADTRDRWVVSAAESTLDRLAVFRLAQESDLRGEDLRRALEAGGAPASISAGIARAIDHYDTTPAYVEAIRRLAVDALELIAGERDEVRRPELAPDEGGDAAVGPLPDTNVVVDASAIEAEPADVDSEAEPADVDSEAEPADVDSEAEPADVDSETGSTATEIGAGSDTDDAEIGDGEVTAEPTSESPESERTEVAEADADEPTVTDSESVGATTAEPDTPVSGSEPGESSAESDDGGGLGDFVEDESDVEASVSGEMYEMDDEEREEIESEFGTDFSTGTEVDEPGEADIDVPDLEEPREEPTEEPIEEESDTDESVADASAETDEAADADIDLEAVVVETMDVLDEGDGADHDAVVDAVVSEYGTDASDVEDAIEDALMGGKCYEPSDGVLKAI